MLSNLVMSLILNSQARFISVDPKGKAIAGGSVVLPASQVPQAISQGNASGRAFFFHQHGTTIISIIAIWPEAVKSLCFDRSSC
jgi:hypothetical protein